MAAFLAERFVRRLALAGAADAELVRRFTDSRCDEAFAELVRRHGPIVYRACRRILGDHHLAEDAFQASFVVLAQKADTIHPPDAVAGWLYGVARKAALEAASIRKRKHREQLPGTLPERPAPEFEFDDTSEHVEAAIAELPVILRSAVLLCEIQGVNRAAAAKRLGIAEGTLSSRLAAARKTLAARLSRKGITLPASLAMAITIPPSLAQAAVQCAKGTASPAALELSQGVLRAMSFPKLKAVILVACVLVGATSVGLLRMEPTVAAPLPKEAEREGVIVLSSHSDEKPLELLKPDGTSLKVIKLRGNHQLYNPRLSPDGKKAVCTEPRGGKGRPFNVYLIDFEAEPAARIARLAENVHNPAALWSRDGKTVYFSHIDPAKLEEAEKRGELDTHQNWSYRVADGKKTLLNLPPHHQIVDVSPDNSTFLTITRIAVADELNIFLLPSTTPTPDKALVLAKGFMYNGRFSPNGEQLVMSGSFVKPDEPFDWKPWDIFVIDLKTDRRTRLNLPPEVYAMRQNRLSWSPNGKQIAVHWEEDVMVPPPPPTNRRSNFLSRVTVCDADGSNAKVIIRRKYDEEITGLDWR